MEKLPHKYQIIGSSNHDSDVTLSANRLPDLITAPPIQYGGTGDKWSPETLLIASVADCFILSFKAIAAIVKLEWISIRCNVDGVLDKVDNLTYFTDIYIKAILTVGEDVDMEKAKDLLAKAEHNCLITNSLKSHIHFNAEIIK